jgi:chromosome segregation ATPase
MARAKTDSVQGQEAISRAREYVEAYVERVKSKGLQGEAAPPFYRTYPYIVGCHALPSGGMLAFYRKGRALDFRVVEKEEVARSSHDFVTYFPKAEMSSGSLKARGASDAERDCAIAAAMTSLDRAREDAREISASTDQLVKNNPWLDTFAEANKATSERLTRTIEEQVAALRREVAALATDQRTALVELAAGMASVEAVAHEDEELAGLRARIEAAERGMQAGLGDLTARLEGIFDDLSTLRAKASKDADESSGAKKLKENLNALGQRLDETVEDIGRLRSEIGVTQEIRDTVFRDSKRMHNMNERINKLEEELEQLQSGSGVAEMRKRLDAMERRMTTEVSIAVAEAMAASAPRATSAPTRAAPAEKPKKKKR